MQKSNNISAIYPEEKGSLTKIKSSFINCVNKFFEYTIPISFESKDMPIQTSVNNIADFVLNRNTDAAIELIKLINKEVDDRFQINSESHLKQSENLKEYLKTK